MRVYFYILIEELEYLNKILRGELDADEYKVSILHEYFEGSILTSLPYEDWVRLNDQETFTTLISL